MTFRHCLFVVGQRIGRSTTEPSERPVQRRDHRAQTLVTQREHQPEPAPRQPATKQDGLLTAHQRPVTVIPLEPICGPRGYVERAVWVAGGWR